LEEGLSESEQGETDIKENVDGKSKALVSEVFGNLLHISSEREVIMEMAGIEGDIDGLDAFPFGGKGEGRADDFRRKRGTNRRLPTSVGFDRGRAKGFRDSGDSGGGEGGGHVGGVTDPH
jgi:hypothetical protein